MRRHARIICGIMMLACLLCPGRGYAVNYIVNGTWSYAAGSDIASDLTEDYVVSADHRVDFTEIMQGSGSLRYSYGKNDTEKRNTLAPYLGFAVNNYIFAYSLNSNATFSDEENLATRVSRESTLFNWSNTVRSNWVKPLWPTLQLSYAESYSSLDRGDGEKESDSRNGSANISWQSDDLKLNYDYSQAKSTNDTDSSVNKSFSHLARLDYVKSFAGRVTTTFSQTYQYNEGEFSARPDEAGTILVPVTISDVRYAIDDTPETGELTNSGNPPNTVIIGPDTGRMNISIQVNIQQVDAIYMYTSADIAAYADNFTWDLYSSSDGENWNLEQAEVDFMPYNIIDQRIEFSIPTMQSSYLKLVAETSALTPTQVAEIVRLEAFKRVSGSSSASKNSYRSTLLNIGYKITNSMRLSYIFDYSLSDLDPGIEQNSMRNAGSLNWSPSLKYQTKFSVNDSRSKTEDNPDEHNTTYNMSFFHTPFQTLRNTLGFSHKRHYRDDELDSTGDSVNFFSAANLYDDLDGSLHVNYTTRDNKIEESKDRSLSTSLSLTARLTPELNMNLNGDYSRDLSEATDNYSADSALNWRVSEILSANVTAARDWGLTDHTRFAMSADMALSSILRTGLGYGFEDGSKGTQHRFTGNLDLKLSKILTFLANGFYTIDDDDVWGVNCSLRARYNTL